MTPPPPAATAGRSRRKRVPDPPDLAPEWLEPASAALAAHARWVGLTAGADTVAADVLADVELRESVLTGVNLAGRDLSRLVARDVRFDRCDLSGVNLDSATLTRVEFVGCRMTGIVMSGARLQDVALRECQADLANWRMSEASYLLLEHTSLRESDFYASQLRAAGLLDCDLRRADFRDCELEDVALHGSEVGELRDARGLAGATIAESQIVPLALSLLAAAGITVTDDPVFGR